MSLPFVWAGSVLTIRRLRATQLPLWLVIAFFFPVANLVFFKILTWLPSQKDEQEHDLIQQSRISIEDKQSQDGVFAEKTLTPAAFKKGELSREPQSVVENLRAGKADSTIREFLDMVIPEKSMVYDRGGKRIAGSACSRILIWNSSIAG